MKIQTYILLFPLLFFGCNNNDDICNLKFADCSPYYQTDFFGIVLSDSSVSNLTRKDSIFFNSGQYDSVKLSYGVESFVTTPHTKAFIIAFLNTDSLITNIGIFYDPPLGYNNHHFSHTFLLPANHSFKFILFARLHQNPKSPQDTQYVYIKDLILKPDCE